MEDFPADSIECLDYRLIHPRRISIKTKNIAGINKQPAISENRDTNRLLASRNRYDLRASRACLCAATNFPAWSGGDRSKWAQCGLGLLEEELQRFGEVGARVHPGMTSLRDELTMLNFALGQQVDKS
jgi:hypothetical protein